MADYNIQMKQYNGTSFDNILPHAYLADTATELAGGGGATEIIAQARAGLSQIATGSYVGTGTYGQNNPTVINCGFKPKIVFIYSQTVVDSGVVTSNSTSKNGGPLLKNTVNGDRITRIAMFNLGSVSTIQSGPYTATSLIDDGSRLISFYQYTHSGYPVYREVWITKTFTSNGVSFFVDGYWSTDYPHNSSVIPEDVRTAGSQLNDLGASYFWVAFA